MIKKILLIEIAPDYKIGGTETYNRNLANILHIHYDDIQVDRVSLYESKKNTDANFPNDHYYSIKPWWLKQNHAATFNYIELAVNVLKFRKLVYYLNSINDYDLIIDSTVTTFKKFSNLPNYFWIQHNTPQFYSHDIFPTWKKYFVNVCQSFFGIKNNLYFCKNIVLFDKYNLDYVKKNRKSSFNFYLISPSQDLPFVNYQVINDMLATRSRLVYFGRIESRQKNIKLLINLNRHLNLIDFYGSGDQELINQLGKNYKGFISPTEDKFKILNKYKYMILMSNYEGFPFSLAQSLACGLPIIIKNSFVSAASLVNKNQNGFLLNKNSSIEEYSNLIKKIYNIPLSKYSELCKNSYEYALNNLSFDIFEKKWISIFEKYLNN